MWYGPDNSFVVLTFIACNFIQITLLSVLSNAFGFEVVLIHTNPFVSEDISANVEDDIRGSSPRDWDEDPRSEV